MTITSKSTTVYNETISSQGTKAVIKKANYYIDERKRTKINNDKDEKQI